MPISISAIAIKNQLDLDQYYEVFSGNYKGSINNYIFIQLNYDWLYSSLLSNDRRMVAKPKSVSPLYSKKSIIKVLFDYIKYLIVYQNIIIIIHTQQHLICTANNQSVKRDSKRLSK